MEPFTWSLLYIVLSLVFLLFTIFNRRGSHLNPPPGPKPWPIIGNFNLIGALPHRSIHDLSQKYGPLMLIKFGMKPVLVGSSVEVAKQILQTQDVNFADRAKTAAGKYTTYNYSGMTWSPYGPYWKQARRIFLTELFTVKRLESYEHIRVEEVKSLLSDLYNSKGKPVNLIDLLSTLGLNIICRMVLGKKVLDASDPSAIVSPDEFHRMLDELLFLNGVLNIGDWIPWLNFLDLQGYIRRMKAVSKKFDRFFEHVLDEHNERRYQENEHFVTKDIVDVLLQFADSPDLDIDLHRDGVKAFTLDLIAGGTGTASVVVEWAISELLKRPENFEKAIEELDRVIGKERWAEEKDMPNLPFINCIIKETMRLHPVAPMLTPRMSREDCKLNGYDILKGTIVLVNIWTIGRDPSIWHEPNEFNPERFLGKDIDVKGHDFELLPFGAGRRMCPAYSAGLKVIQLSIANLLHGFRWKLPTGMSPEKLNMEEIFGLTTPKKIPLVAVVEPRLSSNLYLN